MMCARFRVARLAMAASLPLVVSVAGVLAQTSVHASRAFDRWEGEVLPPADAELRGRIARLAADLGSPDFSARHAAHRELIEIGPPAFAQLGEAYRGTDDFEVRSRIHQIVHEAFLEHHVYRRAGFLGIRQDPRYTPSHADDPRIPEGGVGIRIDAVTEGTAAHRAGLLRDDVIISFNGEPIPGSGIEAVRGFGERICWSGPGAVVHLGILRDDAALTVEATLGVPPVENLRERPLATIVAATKAAHERLRAIWREHFTPRTAQRR